MADTAASRVNTQSKLTQLFSAVVNDDYYLFCAYLTNYCSSAAAADVNAAAAVEERTPVVNNSLSDKEQETKKNGVQPGDRLLHCVARYGRIDFARVLVNRYGSTIDVQNSNGDTPLLLAATGQTVGHLLVIRLLLENGANVRAPSNKQGICAIDLLKEKLFQFVIDDDMVSFRGSLEGITDLDVVNTFEHPYNGGNEGDKLLHCIAAHGSVSFAQYLIDERKADVNVRNKLGNTALWTAALIDNSRSYAVMKVLLDRGADINARNESKESVLDLLKGFLYRFIASGYFTYFRSIVNSTSIQINFPQRGNCNGDTYLHYAAHHGRPEFVTFLLEEKGARVNKKNDKKETPLLKAASVATVDHFAVMKILMEHGADIHVLDAEGRQALCERLRRSLFDLIIHNQFPLFKMLFKKGLHVDVNQYKRNKEIQARDSGTLLQCAARCGQDEFVRFLLEEVNAVAGIEERDFRGRTPLMEAIVGSGEDEDPRFLTTVQLLVDLGGADINATSTVGDTIFSETCQYGSGGILQLLLERNLFSVDTTFAHGATPLHLAMNSFAKVTLLLEKGSDPNKRDNDGNTCLLLACQWWDNTYFTNERTNIVSTLVKHGLDLDARNNQGDTALHVVRGCQLAQVLVELGADTTARNNDNHTPLEQSKLDFHFITGHEFSEEVQLDDYSEHDPDDDEDALLVGTEEEREYRSARMEYLRSTYILSDRAEELADLIPYFELVSTFQLLRTRYESVFDLDRMERGMAPGPKSVASASKTLLPFVVANLIEDKQPVAYFCMRKMVGRWASFESCESHRTGTKRKHREAREE